jgi:hypothetical protein
MKGIPDSIIGKMTGHKSRELKWYQRLGSKFPQQTAEMIRGELEGEKESASEVTGTIFDTIFADGQFQDPKLLKELAEPTGLEPATSDVTGRRSNQLNYDSAFSQRDVEI